MRKNLIIFLMLFITISYSYSQAESDALRFSRNDLFGTARGIAMGGAFGALGGDITGIAQNPAGIAVYRSSELVTTLDFTNTNIKTNLLGSELKDSKFNFAFNNVGYVGYIPLAGDVRAFNIGFSYNRIKNFDRNYKMNGRNVGSSLNDYMAALAYGADPDNIIIEGNPRDPFRYSGYPWLAVLGYNGLLIDPGQGDEYVNNWNGYQTDNYLSISERGYVNSYDFNFGANIQDIVYLGFSASITDVDYSQRALYKEDYYDNTDYTNTGYDLINRLDTEGTGYQVSLGAIFRPIDELRIGVAYHSPTWYELTDRYTTKLLVDALDGKLYDVDAPSDGRGGREDYKLQTPYRWVISAAGILGSRGSISVDYEFTDYSIIKLKDMEGFEYEVDNEHISQNFRGASTLKIGGEYKITPRAAVRAGYTWMQNPYETKYKDGMEEVFISGANPHYSIKGDTHIVSYGGGYRFTPNFYMDIAFSFKFQNDDLYAYPVYRLDDGTAENRSIPGELKNSTFRGLLTMGYKF